MADSKEICIGCVGIIIILAIIGGAMNIFSDHMGWNDNSDNSQTQKQIQTPTPTSEPLTVKSIFMKDAEQSKFDYKSVEWDEEKKILYVEIEGGGWDEESATSGANWDITEVMEIIDSNQYLSSEIDKVGVYFSFEVTNMMTGEEYVVYDGLMAAFNVADISAVKNWNNILRDENFVRYYCYSYQNNFYKYF